MAGFDPELDKEVVRKEAEFERSRIVISLKSYNEGIPKIQIARDLKDQETGEYKWGKLGRLTKEEAQKVIPMLEEISKDME